MPTTFLFMRARDQADYERESDMELGDSPMASRCLSDHLLERKGEDAEVPEEGGTRFLLLESLMPVMPVCRTLGNTQIKGKDIRSVDPAA
jgi:hypothetical protein